MSLLRVEPAGYVITVRDGESLMAAAVRAGYYWPTTCGGHGICTTCAVEVVRGAEHLAPPGRGETRALLEGRGPDAVTRGLRLACQVQTAGDVVVRKTGVRPPERDRLLDEPDHRDRRLEPAIECDVEA